jgi:hypothetical protein
MKLKFPSRSFLLISLTAILSFLLGGGVGYLAFNSDFGPDKFPEIATHVDLPTRPMESYKSSLKTSIPLDSSPIPTSSCSTLSPTWVADENRKAGVPGMSMKSWKNLDLSAATGSALWLDQTSSDCGQKVEIHAALYHSYSSRQWTGPRTFAAYRIGYYGGSGAREIWRSGAIVLSIRKATTSRDATRFTHADWPIATSFTIGKEWTPGFYLIVSLSPKGTIENAAPLVVRSPLASSKLVMVQSFLTWNAYNSFGGRSSYVGPGENKEARNAQRSRVASFDRPIVGSGAFSLQRDAIPFVQFTEKQGINVDQLADLDLDKWPSLAKRYNGVILGGHAEYFTHRIFQTFIALRNSGVNLAIFGGNTALWQVRLEPSKYGLRRNMVIYRVANQDPQTDLTQITIEYADARLNTPSNLITGESTNGVHVYGKLESAKIPKWLKLPKKPVIDNISNDTEGDGIQNNVASPPNIHVIFSGKMELRDPNLRGQKELHPTVQTVWFTSPSGSAIFNAGVTTWSCNLMASCIDVPYDSKSQGVVRATTLQVLKLWQEKRLGRILK